MGCCRVQYLVLYLFIYFFIIIIFFFLYFNSLSKIISDKSNPVLFADDRVLTL